MDLDLIPDYKCSNSFCDNPDCDCDPCVCSDEQPCPCCDEFGEVVAI